MEIEIQSNVCTKAAFARMQKVSKKTITLWDREGRIVTRGNTVLIKESCEKLAQSGRLRTPAASEVPIMDRPEYAFAKDIEDPLDRLSAVRALNVAYATPSIAALSALEAGASLHLAVDIYHQTAVSMMELAFERLADWGIEPVKSNPDAPIIDPLGCARIDWVEVARQRGEVLELEKWRNERAARTARED